MQSINMPETQLRKLFLTRYRALLDLRGVCPHNLACRGAAMEVFLNLSRFPLRHKNYLKAVIRQIRRLIQENVQQMAMPEDDGTLWDVPGHVHGSSLRFYVIEDPIGIYKISRENYVRETSHKMNNNVSTKVNECNFIQYRLRE